METQFMTYKGYPLVRNGNEIYFGYMCDEYVIRMMIEDAQEQNGVAVSSSIMVYQMATDPTVDPSKIIVKNSRRKSLYDALDVAVTWLERANTKA